MNKVIFDDTCSLCFNIKDKLEKLDRRKQFLWIGANTYMKSENIHPNVNQKILNNTLVLINDRNNILTEFYACRYILSKIYLFYPILVFFYIPFISTYIGNKVYKNIAKSRNCN